MFWQCCLRAGNIITLQSKQEEESCRMNGEAFSRGSWEEEINVRDFIQKNYTPYDRDDSFLEGPTQDTTDLWNEVLELSKQEREAGGVLDMDTKIISTITSHGPGYLDKSKEKIVGFQTDKPFKRSLQPYGGIRMAVKACEDNGYHVDPEVVEYFTTHRKTHNAGVFDAYTPEMRACRSAHIITGLPDAYGRGRIIGDLQKTGTLRCGSPDRGQGRTGSQRPVRSCTRMSSVSVRRLQQIRASRC